LTQEIEEVSGENKITAVYSRCWTERLRSPRPIKALITNF